MTHTDNPRRTAAVARGVLAAFVSLLPAAYLVYSGAVHEGGCNEWGCDPEAIERVRAHIELSVGAGLPGIAVALSQLGSRSWRTGLIVGGVLALLGATLAVSHAATT